MQKLLLSLFFITLTFFSKAQETEILEPSSVESFAPSGAENSLLWEIRGNDLKTSSYLFGTIHMIPEDDYSFDEVAQEAFAKTEKVFFEINTETMTDLTTQFSLLMKSFMDGGVTLKDLVSEEDYKLVETHFKEIGLPLAFLGRLKPMILSVFASQSGSSEGGGMDMNSIKSYEMELTEMAQEAKKPIDGLETVQYQMSMFDSIPYKAQAEMLVESIKGEAVTEDDEFGKMVELYKNQDLLGLQELITGSSDDLMTKYERILIVNRNQNWIEPIKENMKKQPTFFAVGAGHLAGEEGVIALLRKEGFDVIPLKKEE